MNLDKDPSEKKGDVVGAEYKTQEKLAKEKDDSTSEIIFSGNIDVVEAGIARGWVVSSDSSAPVPVSILANGKVIGQGVADCFRQDLKDAGLNDGNHGFKIDLLEVGISEGKCKFSLIHAESLEPIKHNNFVIEIEAPQRFSAEMVRVEHGQIYTKLFSNRAIGKQKVQLFHDDRVISEIDIESEDKFIELNLGVPVSLHDSQRKLYKLGIEGYSDIVATQYFTVKPIQTPWQYLKESYRAPGFISQPVQADQRYESFTLQMEAISKGAGTLTMEQVVTVHNVVTQGHEGRKKFPSISLPKFDKPRVSIIVPAYNKFELTYHCVASISLAFNKTSYEVILADDCSTDDTSKAEAVIDNLVVSRNEENLRFLRSCNKASELAKGEFIVFLNNDTEVTSFWLDELVNKLDVDKSVGMTGSKLLNLDGTLQEAGGIVWGNGQPWNVGRNANSYAPEYNYARQVDYLTGAAMCIRSSIWQEVGQFSQELVPCYYEDTDLAFKVRDAGYKTVYTPHSVVVHFEGQSHGTDVTKGLKRYQVINEKSFRSKWFHAYKNGIMPSLEALAIEKDRNVSQRVLVIDYATPMPNKDAGGYAGIQEIKLMVALGFKVTFVPENMAHFGKYTLELQRLGVEVLYAPFYTSVFDVLQNRLQEMDAVYVTRYDVAAKYIDTIRSTSNAKIIFNNADLHFLREMRKALNGDRDENGLQEALQTRDRELNVCRQVDAVLCYNSTEHAVITSHILEAEKLHLTPWVLEDKNIGPDFNKRKGISFLGGYNHKPNAEAVEYLVNDIMPLLAKKRPDIKLYVYGSNMPEVFKEYEATNVEVVGFAEHLDDVFHQHKIFVAPLLSGAGIKGKVLEAMAYGVPTVLTDIAAEGTGLSNAVSTFIAENPKEWVDKIIKLYDDKKLWQKISDNASITVKDGYSFEHGVNKFKEIFESVGLFSIVSTCNKHNVLS